MKRIVAVALFALTTLSLSLAMQACPIQYDAHEEWNCAAVRSAKPCTATVDCADDRLACISGICLEKSPPAHSICTSDGFFKPENKADCADSEVLCSQYCVPREMVSQLTELCCPNDCADNERCCAGGSADPHSAQCQPGGCDCVDYEAPMGMTCCAGGSVNLDNNALHCGACFTACSGENPVCRQGQCVRDDVNNCCGAQCDDCSLDGRVCQDGLCADCVSEAQCSTGQACVPILNISESFDLDAGYNEQLCSEHRRCVSQAAAAESEDCSSTQCDEGLICVRQEQPEDAGMLQMRWLCRKSCAQLTDCPMLPGMGCHQIQTCSGYCL